MPGPSAVTTALLFSGLPTDRFCFEGFLPRTSGARISALEKLRNEERTMIFFEAPHRLLESLTDAVTVLGPDRKAAICREMTKTYEETIRGTLKELVEWAESREILGEISLVMAGFDAAGRTFTDEELAEMVIAREGQGESRKEAIAEVAKATGIAKRDVFDVMVAHKGAGRMGL